MYPAPLVEVLPLPLLLPLVLLLPVLQTCCRHCFATDAIDVLALGKRGKVTLVVVVLQCHHGVQPQQKGSGVGIPWVCDSH